MRVYTQFCGSFSLNANALNRTHENDPFDKKKEEISIENVNKAQTDVYGFFLTFSLILSTLPLLDLSYIFSWVYYAGRLHLYKINYYSIA